MGYQLFTRVGGPGLHHNPTEVFGKKKGWSGTISRDLHRRYSCLISVYPRRNNQKV